jgi:single-stranded DNA-binding protein
MKFTKATANLEGEIVFATRHNFTAGGGVNTYIVKVTEEYNDDDGQQRTYSQSIVVKEFDKDKQQFDKGDIVIVHGFLKQNRYKQGDDWIDKGLEVVAEGIMKVDELPY